MKRWTFYCWDCGHSVMGHYWQLPKTTCPRCGACRSLTSLKRVFEEPKPKAPPARPGPATPLYKELF